MKLILKATVIIVIALVIVASTYVIFSTSGEGDNTCTLTMEEWNTFKNKIKNNEI